MLYERSYMRSPKFQFRGSCCDILILILIGTFLLQSLLSLLFVPSFVDSYFALSSPLLKDGFVWTLLSYGFLHDGPFHLLFNLLGLHFIGRPVENDLGNRNFLVLCLSSLLLGGLFWLTFNSSSQMLIGFSAAVLSFLTFFCLLRPHEHITLLIFFILPLKLKPKFILLGTLGLEMYGFIFSELNGTSSIAHTAHLGGMFCGLIGFFMSSKVLPVQFTFKRSDSYKSKHSQAVKDSNYKVNFTNQSDIQRDVDKILDKINEQGFGALNDSEKKCLEKAKKLLRKD